MTTDFVGFDAPVLARLVATADNLELRGGEMLFEQGEAGDSMYLLVSGRLRVLVESEEVGQVQVGEVVAGETVGEMALLVGEPRSATVVAARDSRLTRITRECFVEACRSEPSAVLTLTRELVHRLQRANRGPVQRAAPATIALLGISPTLDVSGFSQRFANALSLLGSTQIVTAQDAAGRSEAELGEWQDRCEAANRFVLYVADGLDPRWDAHCIRQADLVFAVRNSTEPGTGRQPSPGGRHRELVVVHDGDSTPGAGQGGSDEYQVHHHVRLERNADFARLARFAAGSAIGLVLGGGGARGFAHIGVLRALRELDIPIDAVGGASIGSILGGLVASELEPEEIVELCRRWIVDADLLGEKQVPLVSAVNPRRFDRSLEALFGARLIEELPLRYFCVSANLTAAELVVHDRGSLKAAVRASAALPGILPPAVRNGELLVDGGVLDNLPGDVMRRRFGCRVIACDVSPRRDLAVDPALLAIPSNRELLLHRVRVAHLPTMPAILVRTMMLGSLHATHSVRADADLYLHPPTDEHGIFEFGAIDGLVEIGYRHSMPLLAAWRERPVAV